MADSRMSNFLKNIIAVNVDYNEKIYIETFVTPITLESIK